MSALTVHRRPQLLELDLTELPATPDSSDPLDRLRNRGRTQLRPTLRALHDAAADRHVVGLVARVGGALPWAAMHELRLGVLAFAASGKPTLAWAENFGEGRGDMAAYVLASAFQEIWLQPGGAVGLLGVGVETTFVREALDKVGVEPQFEQRHEYKNAPDILLRTEYSAAHREALDRLTESIYDDAVAAIAEGRRLDPSRVRELIDTGPRTAGEALDSRLVDRLGYRDEVYADIRRRVDPRAELLFADRWTPRRRRLRKPKRGHIALIEVRGAIVSGRSRRGPMGRQAGSDSIGAALRAASTDSQARAVVMLIDSPGGSAVASETIWREVSQVRASGKPVIVSMAGTAASGGYYIACAADVIVALPATITGSIGVFGGKLVVSQLLERLGLTTGTITHGDHALMFSSRRGFNAQERERLAATIDAIYADFVGKVADGRHRTVADIDAVAHGRVWTGSDALRIGLVDELGGLRDALRIARARAGLAADAPVRPAISVAPLRRLRRAKNSDDPRAVLSTPAWPRLADVAAALELPVGAALQMPPVRVR